MDAVNQSGPRATKGVDLRYDLEITLEQAAKGYTAEIRVPVWENVMFVMERAAAPKLSPRLVRTVTVLASFMLNRAFSLFSRRVPTAMDPVQ